MTMKLAILAISLYPMTVFAQGNATVDSPYQVGFAITKKQVDSLITVTNDGVRGADLTPGNDANTTGAICVNVYAFAPADGSLLSCCSCRVGPNAVRALSANRDLVAPPAKGIQRTVIKLLASVPVAGSCDGSAAAPGTLTSGMLAWRTSALPPKFKTETEAAFLPATLSAGELFKLTNLCMSYKNIVPGAHSVCPSCSPQ